MTIKGHLILLLMLCSASSLAGENEQLSRWTMRAGFINFQPKVTAKQVLINGNPLPDAGMSIDTINTAAIFLQYKLSKQWQLETIIARPLDAHAKVSSSLFADNIDAATFKALPIVAFLNYYPKLISWPNFHPYVGIGATYIKVYDAKFSSSLLSLAGPLADPETAKLNIENQKKLLFQLGLSYQLNMEWHINANVIHFRGDTKMSGQLGSQVPLTAALNYEPWIYGLSLGFKF